MNKHITSTIFFLLIFFHLHAQTLYVAAGGTGDGYNWGAPLGSLQQALKVAAPGTQIWVARGTYFPADCKNCTPQQRAAAFEIPRGVKVYGGFAGDETSLREREWKKNPTLLSGNIGRDDHLDNSRTIVYFENADTSTVVDGFFILNGRADADGTPGHRGRSGAAVYNVCTKANGASTPLLSNCRFMDNEAREGAAIFNHGQNGRATVVVKNCAFIRNKARLAGGCIFDHNLRYPAHSVIINCQFLLNKANYGGAYFTNKTNGSLPVFENCRFIRNSSDIGPAALLLSSSPPPHSLSASCFFHNNTSKKGTDFFFLNAQQLPIARQLPGTMDL